MSKDFSSSSFSSCSSSFSSVGCRQLSLDEIKDATNNFHENNVLGSGGEGKVYRGHIAIGRDDEENFLVAVKRLNRKRNSIEFEKEIMIFSKIQHPNLVSLLGYCNELNENIAVYEYMENGSLSDYVTKNSICLSWTQRLNICLGAARGMQYLHTPTDELPKGIIHRDMKPANILLDKNWVAKVSDFGLAKLSDPGQTNSTMPTNNLKGTHGYFAPEYIKTLNITTKVDVYSFGMVLFEVLCRKKRWYREDDKSTYDEDIGDWALENVDTEISGKISRDSLMKFVDIIRKCLREERSVRLTMAEVVLGLEGALKSHECEDHEEIRPKDPRICVGCNAVLRGQFRECIGVWHPECFRCHACNLLISDDEFSMSENHPIHISCYKERYPPCYVCKTILIQTNVDGAIEYNCHPFWQQKYCPSHDYDMTPICKSCNLMEPRDKTFLYSTQRTKICSKCYHSAIIYKHECELLYRKILEFFDGLNLKIEQNFPWLLVQKYELDEAMRLERKLGHHQICETRGLFLSEDQNVSIISRSKARVTRLFTGSNRPIRKYKAKTILILDCHPRLLTGSILAGLMMHAWLDIKGYYNLPSHVEEGICQVLAHMWLDSEIQAGSGNSVASTSSSKKGNLSQFEKQLGEFLKWCIESTDGNGFKQGNKAVLKYGFKTTIEHIMHFRTFPS